LLLLSSLLSLLVSLLLLLSLLLSLLLPLQRQGQSLSASSPSMSDDGKEPSPASIKTFNWFVFAAVLNV
jgi:hypothetical protein